MSVIRSISLVLIAITLVIAQSTSVAAYDELFYSSNDIEWFNPDADGTTCQQSTTTTSNIGGTGTNKDYKGDTIISDAQLKAIEANKPFYIQAANTEKIPWQMLAVIHLRETGLKRYNPSNGNGPYQILGTNYPPSGSVSDSQFQKQTNEAAKFLKGLATSPSTLGTGDVSQVKDVFFGYNGRASSYVKQAIQLGYKADQGYEGSPYVMNIADKQRDPQQNPNWGQIVIDGGPLSYPANDDYGAFVVFSSVAGIATGGSCESSIGGPVAQRVVALAEQELQLWLSGKIKPGDHTKYGGNPTDAWCAYFASWIYNKAGYPLTNSEGGKVAAVVDIARIGKSSDKFIWHDANGYTPQPGDIQVQQGGTGSNTVSHVSIVVAVNGSNITKIGGNQSGTAGPTTSKVTKDNWMPYTIGYVSPKG